MLNRRLCFWLRHITTPAAAFAAAVVVFSFTAPAWAQSGLSKAAKATAAAQAASTPHEHQITVALQKAVGKADGELFGGVLEALGDGKTPLHFIAESTADVKKAGFDGTITGRTVLSGNYAGAFISDHELTVHQGEQTVSTKTQFVCDGKTLWTVKPDAKQYTEQSAASAKAKLSDALMEASFDFVALLGAEAANGFRSGKSNDKSDVSYHVEPGLFRGVPCRVLTIASTANDKTDMKGTFRVYVGMNKRLRALQLKMRQSDDGAAMMLTETVKVMETLTPLPDKAIFTFTPPDGVQKVDKFAD